MPLPVPLGLAAQPDLAFEAVLAAPLALHAPSSPGGTCTVSCKLSCKHFCELGAADAVLAFSQSELQLGLDSTAAAAATIARHTIVALASHGFAAVPSLAWRAAAAAWQFVAGVLGSVQRGSMAVIQVAADAVG